MPITGHELAARLAPSTDKDKVRRWALKHGRKVLWKDDRGVWHAATDRFNTPKWALEAEDIDHATK